jgi:hypothetical protein
MKIAIINHNNHLESANSKISHKIYNVFCGRYVPYKISKGDTIEEGKHVGVFFLAEKNPELVNKILNLIKDESRENMG